MKNTFCQLYFRNLNFYIRNVRNTSIMMALVTAVMQMVFYYKIGDMQEPPPGVFFMYAFDTWTVATVFQTIMTMQAMELMEREKKMFKFKYSPHSYFLGHWFSSFMALKFYGVISATLSFWVLSLPNPTAYHWFTFVCMELVLTMNSACFG